jgi:hypothetical protein
MEAMQQQYSARWAEEPRRWAEPSLVHVLRGEEVTGSYTRNYPNLFHSFYPFVQGDQEYALYSPDYTTTRVMTLPDCRDLGGEEPHSKGFCPVDYYVPFDSELGFQGQFGFVAGAVWADERSLKIQYLDLSQIAQGVLKREERFGYLHLPEGMRLKDAVLFDYYELDHPIVKLTVVKAFHLETGQEEEW